MKTFESKPDQESKEDKLTIDSTTRDKLEAKFSKKIDEFKDSEFFDEGLRLVTLARNKNNQDYWEAAWLFFREADKILAKRNIKEQPGEREAFIEIKSHTDNPVIKADVEKWFEDHPRNDGTLAT